MSNKESKIKKYLDNDRSSVSLLIAIGSGESEDFIFDLFYAFEDSDQEMDFISNNQYSIKADIIYSLLDGCKEDKDKYKKFLEFFIDYFDVDLGDPNLRLTSNYDLTISSWLVLDRDIKGCDKSVEEYKKELQYLISKGLDIHNVSNEPLNENMLLGCAYWGSINQAKALIELGCDPFKKSYEGISPYDAAVDNNPEMASLFVHYKKSLEFKEEFEKQVDVKNKEDPRKKIKI